MATAKAKSVSETSVDSTPSIPVDVLADALTKALQANAALIQANAPPRKITTGERRSKGPIKNAFNPAGKRFKLDGEYFQNGAPISERRISPEEADALTLLTEGKYGPPDFPVLVRIRKSIEGAKKVHITYPEQTQNDRMKFSRLYGSFELFCVKLAAEAKAQLAQRKREARELLLQDDPIE